MIAERIRDREGSILGRSRLDFLPRFAPAPFLVFMPVYLNTICRNYKPRPKMAVFQGVVGGLTLAIYEIWGWNCQQRC